MSAEQDVLSLIDARRQARRSDADGNGRNAFRVHPLVVPFRWIGGPSGWFPSTSNDGRGIVH